MTTLTMAILTVTSTSTEARTCPPGTCTYFVKVDDRSWWGFCTGWLAAGP